MMRLSALNNLCWSTKMVSIYIYNGGIDMSEMLKHYVYGMR